MPNCIHICLTSHLLLFHFYYDRIIHSDWNPSRINSDVAVIRLSKGIKFNAYAAKINLASSVPSHNTPSIVTGWGYTNYQQQTRPTILQALDTVAYAYGRYYSSIYDSKTQVASYNSNKGICMGDSGGPLVNKNTGELYGVCSYVLTRK